jgi:Ca2+-binding RTX toxin-like protein
MSPRTRQETIPDFLREEIAMTLCGRDDADLISNDDLRGLGGNDTLVAGPGNDLAVGGTGDDALQGGPGNDTLWGLDGDDALDGSFDDDVLRGDLGNDTLNGGRGDDTLFGGAGNDVLSGEGDDDLLITGNGADVAEGGGGRDVIYGYDTTRIEGLAAGSLDTTADRLNGGDGADTITGNDGDTITGGDGADMIRVLGLDQTGLDSVAVTDFDPAEDTLMLVDRTGADVVFPAVAQTSPPDPDSIVEIRATPDGTGTEVIYDDQIIALLEGIALEDLAGSTAWIGNPNVAVVSRLDGMTS